MSTKIASPCNADDCRYRFRPLGLEQFSGDGDLDWRSAICRLCRYPLLISCLFLGEQNILDAVPMVMVTSMVIEGAYLVRLKALIVDILALMVDSYH